MSENHLWRNCSKIIWQSTRTPCSRFVFNEFSMFSESSLEPVWGNCPISPSPRNDPHGFCLCTVKRNPYQHWLSVTMSPVSITVKVRDVTLWLTHSVRISMAFFTAGEAGLKPLGITVKHAVNRPSDTVPVAESSQRRQSSHCRNKKLRLRPCGKATHWLHPFSNHLPYL